MKRVKKENTYPLIKIIKPLLFWHECRFCKREFRRELGYQIEDYTIVNPRVFWSYCCNECASSIDEVKVLVNKTKLNSPKPPPLPPSKKSASI